MKELNKDIAFRDKIIFGKYRPNMYKFTKLRKFDGLDVNALSQLIDENFADPDCCKELAPTISEVYDFMTRYPKYKAHGYVTSLESNKYGVFIEGVDKGEPHETIDEFQDYMNVFRFSDTFDHMTMYCLFN